MNVVEASGLGKRYGGTWALRECTLKIPAGRVAALVGPNGAGKSTLLNLAVGLTAPSAGDVTVLGGRRAGSPAALDGIAFVAQDTPLYKNLRVADMIYITRSLNRRFDQPYARARLAELGIPPKRKAGKLSGGQQAQLALTLALARRPRLLVLDEPVAMLDPVARHDFMATVLAAAADDGVSVLLSSHVLTELERVADYLILLSRGRCGWPARSTTCSRTGLTGPAAEAGQVTDRWSRPAGRGQAHLLVRTNGPTRCRRLGSAPGEPGRTRPGLPARARAARCPAPHRRRTVGGDAMTALTVPPAGRDRAAAGAVAADGLGHLAPAPDRAGRRGRAARRAGGVPVDRRPVSCTTPTPPRPPATRQARPPARPDHALQRQHEPLHGEQGPGRPAAAGARADRGVRRGAGAGPGAGDRHLPVRLDPGLRPVALGARQAGGARGRGGRRRRRFSVLFSWYYQPYFATGNQALSLRDVPAR